MVGDRQIIGNVVLPLGWQAITATIILLAVPTIWPGPLGWLQGIIAVPISYCLITLGTERASKLLINAILLAGLLATVFGSLPAFIFTCTMLPVGIIIGKAQLTDESPTKAGLQAVGILLLLWVSFWTIYGSLTQTNPYREMLTSMDESLTAAASLYQSDTKLSLNDKEDIANTIQLLREFMLQIAPALLVVTAISTVWLNMLLGQWLVNRNLPSRSKWPQFRHWRLPEPLIWVVIGSGIAASIPIEQVKTIGINQAAAAVKFFKPGEVTTLSNSRYQEIELHFLLGALNRDHITRTPVGLNHTYAGCATIIPDNHFHRQ